MAITALCTVCGINEAPMPESIEIDPICDSCLGNNADETPHTIAGFPIPTLVREFNNDEGGCPGWNDSCGNDIEDGDLCPDCTMARLDAQSPRIQR